MPNQRRRIYWDANVWQSYINGIAERLPVLDALLADSASDNGAIEIWTSALSQVEVAFGEMERQNVALDLKIEEKIDKLWADRDAVKLVEYHDGIGVKARQLMRFAITRGWQLKPFDAIHLATGQQIPVVDFHTYDDKLLKFSNEVGFIIRYPISENPRLFV